MLSESLKPIILSIETATPVCSVALYCNDKMAGLTETFVDRSHSSNLIPMIQELLDASNLKFSDLNAVAVSKGPGSYTGLRIGISTAKGICFARDIPLIGIGTLNALARQIEIGKFNPDHFNNLLICPMLDARRMEVYTMLCKIDGTVVEPVHAKVINMESFRDQLKKHEIVFIGPGSEKCREILGHEPNAIFKNGYQASASTIGQLAYEEYLNENFENTALFEPFYLKEFQTTIPKSKL